MRAEQNLVTSRRGLLSDKLRSGVSRVNVTGLPCMQDATRVPVSQNIQSFDAATGVLHISQHLTFPAELQATYPTRLKYSELTSLDSSLMQAHKIKLACATSDLLDKFRGCSTTAKPRMYPAHSAEAISPTPACSSAGHCRLSS